MGKSMQSFAQWRLQESLSEYTFYERKFRRMLLTMFTWGNLPNGISARFIEDKLYYNGFVIFYKDNGGFYRVSQATPIGLNGYEEPIGYRTFSVGTENDNNGELIKAKDCVPIWNDFFCEGNVMNVNFFAKRLSNIEKTIDVNLEQLKNPYLIACPDGQRQTLKQVMKEKSNGDPYIVVSEDFGNIVDVKVFDLHVQNHVLDLSDTKHEYENEGLTFFGINNVQVIKKERLVSGEAKQNDEQILLQRNAMFKARKDAVEKINEKFQLEIPITIELSVALEHDTAELKRQESNGGDE